MREKKWHHYLPAELLPLVNQSLTLLRQAQRAPEQFDNYDYVVFPFAKAYEPFLKTYLYNLGLISERVYYSKKFSLSRALNPDVHLEQRDENWYFDDLVKKCGEKVAREIWQTWLLRNQILVYEWDEFLVDPLIMFQLTDGGLSGLMWYGGLTLGFSQ